MLRSKRVTGAHFSSSSSPYARYMCFALSGTVLTTLKIILKVRRYSILTPQFSRSLNLYCSWASLYLYWIRFRILGLPIIKRVKKMKSLLVLRMKNFLRKINESFQNIYHLKISLIVRNLQGKQLLMRLIKKKWWTFTKTHSSTINRW